MFERDYRSGLSAAENIGLERGLKKGRTEAKLDDARNMLLKNVGSIEQIAEVTGLPEEKIKELAEELKIEV